MIYCSGCMNETEAATPAKAQLQGWRFIKVPGGDVSNLFCPECSSLDSPPGYEDFRLGFSDLPVAKIGPEGIEAP